MALAEFFGEIVGEIMVCGLFRCIGAGVRYPFLRRRKSFSKLLDDEAGSTIGGIVFISVGIIFTLLIT